MTFNHLPEIEVASFRIEMFLKLLSQRLSIVERVDTLILLQIEAASDFRHIFHCCL